ncbi:MAG: hypothetical protein HQL30_07645 [Candidatus Omnitrophica bacterium]|nr:hypothetical protein [Candidatus Omnitrophota bacterium]
MKYFFILVLLSSLMLSSPNPLIFAEENKVSLEMDFSCYDNASIAGLVKFFSVRSPREYRAEILVLNGTGKQLDLNDMKVYALDEKGLKYDMEFIRVARKSSAAENLVVARDDSLKLDYRVPIDPSSRQLTDVIAELADGTKITFKPNPKLMKP